MGQPYRIVSYNVRYFSQKLGGLATSARSLTAIATALRTLGPDLICLQEVESCSRRSRSHAPQLDRLRAAMGEETPYEARHFAAHRAGRGARALYTTGLAMLFDARRFVPIAEESIDLGGHGERRIGARLQLLDRETQRSLHVFCAHLSLPSPILVRSLGDGDNQLDQARRLGDWIRQRAGSEPFVVGGDFNARPQSRVHHHLTSIAGFATTPWAPRPTAGVGPLRACIDHLLAAPSVAWLDDEDSRPFGDRDSRFHGLSDHVPLIARFAC